MRRRDFLRLSAAAVVAPALPMLPAGMHVVEADAAFKAIATFRGIPIRVVDSLARDEVLILPSPIYNNRIVRHWIDTKTSPMRVIELKQIPVA